jgi:hypothetical protein
VPTPLPHGYSPARAMIVTFGVDSGLRVISGHYGAQKPPGSPDPPGSLPLPTIKQADSHAFCPVMPEFSEVNPGYVVDRGDGDAPDQPHNPDRPC